MDTVIAIGWALELSLLAAPKAGWFLRVAAALAIWRIVDLLQGSLNTLFFEGIPGKPAMKTASIERTAFLSVTSFVELALLFALLYPAGWFEIGGHAVRLSQAQALYFSFVTQTTIGYGDITPVGWTRGAAAAQVFMGIMLVGMIFGRVVASLRPLRDE